MFCIRRWEKAVLIAGALMALSQQASAGDVARRAVGFDGFDDFIHIPYDQSLDSTRGMTVEGWLFPATISQGGVFGMWGNGGLPDRYLVYIDSGQLIGRIAIDGVPGTTSVQTDIAPQRWMHVALTYDGTDLRLYLNGNLMDVTNAPGSLPSVNTPFRMGIEDIFFADPPAYLAGQLDEVRVWRVARTADQIACTYNEVIASDSEGLVAQWSFDNALGAQEVVDSTALGNNGSLGADLAPAGDDPTRGPSEAPIRWRDLGFGLVGSFGVPQLCTQGTLIGGTPYSFEVTNARPNSTATFIVGLSQLNAPLLGGTLVPNPDFVFGGIPVNPLGEVSIGGIWPGAVPPCLSLYFQFWIVDPAGPMGFSSTVGYLGQTPN